jgi:hypothetical protein
VRFGQYVTDDMVVHCALWMADDTFVVMGFTTPPTGTPLRPNKLATRKEVFVNAAGKQLKLPIPVAGGELVLGHYYMIRGDSTYFAVSTLGEINAGEST